MFLKLLISWDFHTQLSIEFRIELKNKKKSSEQQFCGWKCLVDERGQRRMARLLGVDRKATVSAEAADDRDTIWHNILNPWT